MTEEILLLLCRIGACLLITIFTALTCCIVAAEPLRWKVYLKVFAVTLTMLALNILLLPQDSPLKMLFALISVFLSYRYVYRFTGHKLALKTFIGLGLQFGGDIFTGFVFSSLFDSKTMEAMRYMTDANTLLLQFFCGSSMVILAMFYRLNLAFFQHRRINLHLGYLLRPICLMGIVCIIYINAFRHANNADQVIRFQQMLPDFVVVFLLLIIGTTYVLQDIRSYKQAEENKTLQHQQSLQTLLLQDTRVFRHNISNMLYGFQGTLLSGDLDAIKAYYDNMAASCQMINNENVISLKRLPSAAVSTLLLHKIHSANEQKIPFYTTVEENIRWFGLKDEEMVQVLGILLDNALEAARESAAPFVSFEARNIDDALSITIRNTCADGDMPVFTSHTASTKEGHEGLGLKSLQDILAKHSHVLFNIYTRGRYVEASLMIYK